MIAGRYQSKNIFPLMLSGMLLLMAALWLGPASVAALAEEGSADAAASKTVPCKGLKPYNNIDELLYQFYINMESDCLFEMPVEELEKVWGIRIFDDDRLSPSDLSILSETEFYYKPYKSEKDAFYVQVGRYNKDDYFPTGDGNAIRFFLKITNAFLESKGALFPEKELPKLLPEPDAHLYTSEGPCAYSLYDQRVKQDVNCFSSGWLMPDYTRTIQLKPHVIEISRYYPPGAGGQSIEKKRDVSELPTLAAKGADFASPCKSLKPFDNIDEFLYQFYINLDSDCLFTTPLAELEKVWDIKILSQERINAGQFDPNEFALKPYKSEKDAFYVEALLEGDFFYIPKTGKEVRTVSFALKITDEYYKQHATLFPDGSPPKLLPKPLHAVGQVFRGALSVGFDSPPIPKISDGVNRDAGSHISHYYWLNSSKETEIALHGNSGITSVTISTHIQPAFKEGH